MQAEDGMSYAAAAPPLFESYSYLVRKHDYSGRLDNISGHQRVRHTTGQYAIYLDT